MALMLLKRVLVCIELIFRVFRETLKVTPNTLWLQSAATTNW